MTKYLVCLFLFTLLLVAPAESQYALGPWPVRFNFNEGATDSGPSAIAKLKPLTNSNGTTFQINSDGTFSPGDKNDAALTMGGFYIDSSGTGTPQFKTNTKMSIVIKDIGGKAGVQDWQFSDGLANFWFRQSTTTLWGSHGYRVILRPIQAGTDSILIYRHNTANTTWTRLGGTTHEIANNDTFKVAVVNDAVRGLNMIAYVTAAGGATDSVSVSDVQYPDSLFHVWFTGMKMSTPAKFDDLALTTQGAVAPQGSDTQAPVFASGSPALWPYQSWTTTTADTMRIFFRVQDTYTGSSIDSIGVYFRDSLKYGFVAGSTQDTSVYVSIGRRFGPADAGQNYGWRIRVKDNSGNLLQTTGSVTVTAATSGGSSTETQVLVYMPIWTYGQDGGQYPLLNVNWYKRPFTHLIVFSASPDPVNSPYFNLVTNATDSAAVIWGGGSVGAPPPAATGGRSWLKYIVDSCHANGIKVILGVAGGIGDAAKMSPIMADSTKTQLWVNSYTDFCVRWDLDGVDLDWEYPDNLANWQRGVRIMRRAADNVATRIGRKHILTTALPTYTTGMYVSGPELAAAFDYTMWMSYDNGQGSSLWLNNPIAPPLQSDFPGPPTTNETAPASISTYWSFKTRGTDVMNGVFPAVAKNKMAIGLANYGWTHTPTNQTKRPLMWEARGSSTYLQKSRYGANRGSDGTTMNAEFKWLDSAKSPYVTYQTNAGVWKYEDYETPASMTYKAQWAIDHGTNIMVYEMSNGFFPGNPPGQRFPLLDAIAAVVGLKPIALPPPAPSEAGTWSPTNGTTGVSPTTQTFSWPSVSGATGYRLIVETNSSKSTPIVQSNYFAPTTNSATLTQELAYGTTYAWWVSAENSAGTSVWSSKRTFTTLVKTVVDTPNAVTLDLPAANAGNVSLSPTFTWHTAVDTTDTTTSYSFELAKADTTTLLSRSNIGTTTTVTGLTKSTSYLWRVRGNNSQLSGPWSSYRKFTTIATDSIKKGNGKGRRSASTVTSQYNALTDWYSPLYDPPAYTTYRSMNTVDEIDTTEASNLFNFGFVGSQPGYRDYDGNWVPLSTGGAAALVNLDLPGNLSVAGTSVFNGPTYNTGTESHTGDETHSGEMTLNGTVFANSGLEVSGTFNIAAGTSISGLPATQYLTAKNIADSLSGRKDTLANYIYFTSGGTVYGSIGASANSLDVTGSGSQAGYGTAASYVYFKANGPEFGGKVAGSTPEANIQMDGIIDTVRRFGVDMSVATPIAATAFAATDSGLYAIDYYLTTTVAGSAGTGKIDFAWNDGASKTYSTPTMSLSSTTNTGFIADRYVLFHKSGTLTWAVTTSGATGTPKATLRMIISKLMR
jgi:GH18 family chitinase